MDVFKNEVACILSKELGICMSLRVINTKSLHINNLLLFTHILIFDTHVDYFLVVNTSVSTSCSTLSSHLVFAGLILLLLFQNFLMSCTEFLLNFFLSGDFSLHPGVSNNVSHSKTLARNELEHASDHIGKFFGETPFLVATMRSPENICTVARNELVEAVTVGSVVEWRVASDHDE